MSTSVNAWDVPEQKDYERCGRVYVSVEEAKTKNGGDFYKHSFLFEEIGGEDRTHKTNTYDTGFKRFIAPSLKAIFNNPNEVEGKWMLYKWTSWRDYSNNGVNYAKENGRDFEVDDKGKEFVSKPTIQFLKVFADDNEAIAYHNENLNSETADGETPEPATKESTVKEGGITKDAAEQMIPVLVGMNLTIETSGPVINMDTLSAQINSSLSPHFSIDSEEVKAVISSKMAQAENE